MSTKFISFDISDAERRNLGNYVCKAADRIIPKGNAEIVPIDELKIVANNPNKHTKEHLAEIIRSINLHGQMVPVLINSQKQLITGEGRYLALKQMKCRYIAALTIENLPPEALRAYRIADNQLTRTSQFDFTILQDEFKFLYDFKILGTDLGFSTIQVDKILNYQIVESTQKEKTKAAKEDVANWENKDIPKRVNSGELWRCGDSFVLCANSLDSASFEFLMQGEQAQVVVTDAPYNVPIAGHVCGLGKTKHEEFSMASGEMSPEEFKINFVTPYMQNCIKFAQDGALHYHFIDWRSLDVFLNVGKNLYTELKNICVWVKSNGGGMGSLYRSQHEFACVFNSGKAPHVNNIELGKNGRYRTNVWQYPGVIANTPETLELLKLHPTCKPISMIQDILLDSSNINDVVLDYFGGSGSTLIAASRCKRRARVIEISEKYCDVILWRWEKETGKKAVLVIQKVESQKLNQSLYLKH